MITTSHSDDNLSSQGRDRCDFVPRSQSLNAVPNYTSEFSEDELSPVIERGSARIREASKKKTTTKATTTSKSKASSSKATSIKGRRRIKEENDVIDVDFDMYT